MVAVDLVKGIVLLKRRTPQARNIGGENDVLFKLRSTVYIVKPAMFYRQPVGVVGQVGW